MTKRKNGSIEFWRFAFTLLIVFGHTLNQIKSNPNSFLLSGAIGVEFFFIVSGYLMANTINKDSTYNPNLIGTQTKDFILKKFSSLMPGALIAFFVSFIVMHIADPKSIFITIKDLLLSIWSILFVEMNGMLAYRPNPVTWYISAMLITMLVLYPVAKKYKNIFSNIIAPIIFLLSFGILYKNNMGLLHVYKWISFTLFGLIRAFGELSLGFICFNLTNRLKDLKLNTGSRIILSLIEMSGYLSAYIWSIKEGFDNESFTVCILIAISVIISFSKKGIISNIFDNKMSYFLGKFSFYLYLSHYYWGTTIKTFFEGRTYEQYVIIVIVISILNALLLMIISDFIKKSFKKINIKKNFVLSK